MARLVSLVLIALFILSGLAAAALAWVIVGSGVAVAIIVATGLFALGGQLWWRGFQWRKLRPGQQATLRQAWSTWAQITAFILFFAFVLGGAVCASILWWEEHERALAVGAMVADGVFFLAGFLWWYGKGTDRKWDEIGRTLMVGVVVAMVLGGLQYLVDQRQKQRDFVATLNLQPHLRGADLHDKSLSGVRLRGKDLTLADLRDVKLDGANLVGTVLREADLDDAKLSEADLRGVDLREASLVNADLRDANLKGAEILGANLRGADLRGASLDSADLSRACLAGADLRNARLAGANLDGGVLTEAKVQGASFEEDLRPANLDRTGLARVEQDIKTDWPDDFRASRPVHGIASVSSIAYPREPQRTFRAKVVAIADGDTMKLEAEPAARHRLPYPGRARLIGVNAPDPEPAPGEPGSGDPGGDEARRFVEQTLLHRTVDVELGTNPAKDSGERHLVYIWLNRQRTFNEELLERGHAEVQVRTTNSDFLPQFLAAELRAKQRGLALWRECPSPE